MDDKYLSTEHEPALGAGPFDLDPAETRATPIERRPDDLEMLRDDVAIEPALPQHADSHRWNGWLRRKREECSLPGNLAATVAVALLGGPFAIFGAMITAGQGFGPLLYVIVFGPVVEELLKQSGMTYLLEKKPYRVFSAWQFLFAAVVSGLAFATIENLVYIHVYMPAQGVADIEATAAWRWAVCTPLHVGCSMIASLGLIRAWRRHLHDGRPADLSAAFPWFVAAMVLHGAYNSVAMLL